MPRADIRVNLAPHGATLSMVARELRRMDDAKVTGIFKARLEDAARPFPGLVRASVMAIPTTGVKHTGLRARIAACAQTASWVRARTVSVAVEMNPKLMPPGEMGLPLYMEGVAGGRINHARWRHPVFQTARNPDTWVQQPARPYFYQAASGYGRAAGEALKTALEDITRELNG